VSIKPVDIEQVSTAADNIYEAIVIASKRARQIHTEMKIEFEQRKATLEQLIGTTETEEDLESGANPDQLKISLEFEKRPKPTETALEELQSKKLEWRYKETEQTPAKSGE